MNLIGFTLGYFAVITSALLLIFNMFKKQK